MGDNVYLPVLRTPLEQEMASPGPGLGLSREH